MRIPHDNEPAAARSIGADGEVAPASTAARVWPGSHLLASYLHQTDVVAALNVGKSTDLGARPRVIELGAGSGVPGLVAWTLGAAEVVLTDLEENLPRIRETALLNGATPPDVQVVALDWMQPPPLELERRCWDVILAADCVFWTGLFVPLLTTLRTLARAGHERGEHSANWVDSRASPLILLTVTARLDRAEQFVATAKGANWHVEEVSPMCADSRAMMASTHTRCYRLVDRTPAEIQTLA